MKQLICLLLVCLPALAFAVDLKPYNVSATAMYIQVDENLNGNIDRHEISDSFRKYDTNDNGRISRSEYTAFVNANEPTLHDLSNALYDLFDVDSDDQLDKHDFDNFYTLMDGDSDGVVSHFEFVRYWSILFKDLENYHVRP